MTNLGDRLHSLRKSKSLTQEAFASSLNERYDLKINKSMVSKWENNIDTPSLNSVKYMAIFFDVSLDYLLGVSDCNQDFPVLASAPADPLQLTEQEERLLVTFRRLNKYQQERLIAYAEGMLDAGTSAVTDAFHHYGFMSAPVSKVSEEAAEYRCDVEQARRDAEEIVREEYKKAAEAKSLSR